MSFAGWDGYARQKDIISKVINRNSGGSLSGEYQG